jgi:hypothetical protein
LHQHAFLAVSVGGNGMRDSRGQPFGSSPRDLHENDDDNIKSKSFSFHTGLPAIVFVCVVSSLAMIRISFEQIMLKKIRLDSYYRSPETGFGIHLHASTLPLRATHEA